MKGKRRTRKINPKFYVFVGAVAAGVIVVLFLLFNVQTATVQQGVIPFETKVTAVLARDEQVVKAQNYGKANYIAAEGERVDAGASVMEVYKWGYNEKVMNDLIDYQTKIEEYQENGLSDDQLNTFNTQIADKTTEIKNIISGSAEGDVIKAEQELKTLMAQKQKYLTDTVSADQQLQDFYTKEAEVQSRVDNWRDTLTAPGEGVISYYFDGAEDVINAGNIQNIKVADLKDILNGTTTKQDTVSNDDTEKPVYRLVNSFKWYLLVYSKDGIPEFTNDRTFSVAFNDYVERQYQGKIAGTVKEDDGTVYAIEMSEDIGDLLNVRRADARVFAQFTGLKIPEKAIVEKEGTKGVNVVSDKNEKTFVPVTVDIIKDGNAIVTPVTEGSLAADQRVEV